MKKELYCTLAFLFFLKGIFGQTEPLENMMQNKQLKQLISQEEISNKILKTAKMLNDEYANKQLTIIMIMKGSICFAVDLLRELSPNVTLEYLNCSSYGKRGDKRGDLVISGLDRLNIANKHVLVLDDIFDSGITMSEVIQKLSKKNPASIKSIVLLDKEVKKQTPYRVDYSLFTIPNLFVVGYGLDYKEYFRGLKEIYVISSDK